jgi:hypothetical protein
VNILALGAIDFVGEGVHLEGSFLLAGLPFSLRDAESSPADVAKTSAEVCEMVGVERGTKPSEGRLSGRGGTVVLGCKSSPMLGVLGAFKRIERAIRRCLLKLDWYLRWGLRLRSS